MVRINLLKSPAGIHKLLRKTGVAVESSKTLYTSVLLIKDHLGQWQLAHFKELLILVRPNSEPMLEEDISRLNNIALQLQRHGMIDINQRLTYDTSVKHRTLKNTDLIENGGEWNVEHKFTLSSSKLNEIYEQLRKLEK